MRILAISGSLRAASSNTALLRAARTVAPAAVEVVLYEGLGEIPPFNPDLDGEEPHPAVADWRARLREADAVVISSPEYAHGVPGVLKNALDWVVGSGELVDKPMALFNPSPRSTYAQASLVETLTVMSARLVAAGSVTLNLATNRLDAAGLAADPEIAAVLRDALVALAGSVAGGT
jgi:NAD(P)H-dependent FMN reductase